MMDERVTLYPGERVDDLQRGGLRILQRPDGFRFGTDAVLLADFAGVKRGEHVADMGTGTGVLPLLLSARAEGTTFDAFEAQADVAEMAGRSAFSSAESSGEGEVPSHKSSPDARRKEPAPPTVREKAWRGRASRMPFSSVTAPDSPMKVSVR